MSRLLMVLGISIVILTADRSRGQEQNPPSSKEAQAEIARLQKELKSLVEEIRRRDAIILRLTKEAKSFRDEAVASQNALVAVKNRLEGLLEPAIRRSLNCGPTTIPKSARLPCDWGFPKADWL